MFDIKNEYIEYEYDLNDFSWKDKLPTVKITKSEELTQKPKVTVVIANFNNEPYLARMMDSLVNQSLGIENIQIIFCDDKSTDNSLEVVFPYTKKYPNIEIIELEKNTGGAHGPRNVGLQYVRGEYLVILDADDWYAENGLETLANLLDKSESSIVFGGIVRVQNDRKELFSPAYVEKDIIDRPISELPYDFFNWMGPQGNMMRTSVVIEHNLHFVNQRVADDVTFFYQILRYSKTISQTKELTIYLNRDEDNMSLSKTVNETFLVSWLRALSYIISKIKVDKNMELFLSRRLEWLTIDYTLRFDTSYGFSLSSVKQMKKLIDQYLGELPLDPSKYFQDEPQKIAWNYLVNNKFDELVRFVEWYTLSSQDKRVIKEDDIYYFVSENQDIPKVMIPVKLKGEDACIEDDDFVLIFSLYTSKTLSRVEIRNEENPFNRLELPVTYIENCRYKLILSQKNYFSLDAGKNILYVVLNEYEDHMISIGNLQQYCIPNGILQDNFGVVSINKDIVNNRYFVIRNKPGIPLGEVVEEAEGFSKSGEKVRIFLGKVKSSIINKDLFLVPKILDTLTNQQLKDKYKIKIGIMNALEDISVYTTVHDVVTNIPTWKIIKNKTFIIYNIEFTPNGDLLYYVGNGFIKSSDSQFVYSSVEKIHVKKPIYSYPNPNFTNEKRISLIKVGKVLAVKGLYFDDRDVPRFKLENGTYITANPDFVAFIRNQPIPENIDFFTKIKTKLGK